MTTVLSSKGQVVIPGEVRQRLRLQSGADLIVLTTISGDIVLRPVRKPRRSLVSHLRGLAQAGVKISPLTDEPPAPLEL